MSAVDWFCLGWAAGGTLIAVMVWITVELHERQIAWKESQNHSLQLFSDRTGKGYVIENGWPVYARSLVEA